MWKPLVLGILVAVALLVAFLAAHRHQSSGATSVDKSAFPAHVPVAPSFDRQHTNVKIVFVGLDSLDWQIIDPLMNAGRMPHFKKLIAHGCWARLRTIAPVLSPVVWTSIGTGREPADHGILDFIVKDQNGQSMPISSRFRKVKAIWNIATAVGLKVGVVGWWATWPAEAVNGYVVTDKIAYQLFGLGSATGETIQSGMVYPDSIADEIRPFVAHKKDVTMKTIRHFLNTPAGWETSHEASADDIERLNLFRGYIAQAESYRRIGLELHRRYRPDLDLVYFEAPDEVSHIFICFRPPAMPGSDQKRVTWFGPVVDRYYEECDRILGDFADCAETEGAGLVVCSDHGFKNGADRPNTDSRIGKGGAADWHRKHGILICSGGPFVSGGKELDEASVLDVAPTVMAAMGIPIAKNFAGHVLEAAFKPDFLRAYPVRNIDSYETRLKPADATSGASASTQIDKDQLDALAALGYIGSGSNRKQSTVAPTSDTRGETQDGSNFHNNRGTLFLEKGMYDDAIAEFQKALSLNPAFLAAKINLSRAYRMKGDSKNAQSVLEPLLQAAHPDKGVYNELARIAMDQEKNYPKAEQLFRTGLEQNPNDIELMNSLAEFLDITGRYEEAIAVNKKCIEIDVDNEQGYNNIGNIYRRRMNPKEAEAWYRRAIKADFDFPGSYNNLGLVLQDQGRLDDAEKQYEIALRKYTAKGNSRHEYAVVLNSIGSLSYIRAQKDPSFLAKARAKFEESVRTDPKYPEAHNNLGAVFGLQGKPDEEIREYETAVRLDPQYPDGLFNLGRVYLRSGRTDEALAMFQRVLQVSPGQVAARCLIGTIYVQKGDTAQALMAFDDVLRNKPDSLPGITQKEKLLTHLNRLSDAASLIEAGLRFHPSDKTLLNDLLALYNRLSRPDDAARIKSKLDSLGHS